MAKFLNLLRLRSFANPGDAAAEISAINDTHPRLRIDAGGKLTWGDGSTSGDVTLYRDGENVLKTDDALKADSLYINGVQVDVTGAVTDDALVFDGTKFVPTAGGGGGGATNLNGLTDVTLTTPTTGQVLKYDGTQWINDTDNAGTTINSIDDIGDVTITSASSGQTLTYDGASWINQQVMPSGSITQFAGSSAPTGWLTCDGTTVSRTTYAALFAVIGTTYGAGDGSTTFGLPNLKGRIPVGRDASQTEFDVLGETGGAKTHTLTTAEMPSHTHTQNSHNHSQNSHSHSTNGAGAHGHAVYGLNTGIPAGTNGFGIGMLRLNDGGYNYATTGVGDHSHSVNGATATNNATTATNNNTGGDGAHNNLQPYIVLNYIIKV